MADIKYPEGNYVIASVGPSRPFSFNGQDGNQVTLIEYKVQFNNIPDWVNINVNEGKPAPQVGESMEGHIEDTGKYGYKFVKKRTGGGFGGGKNYAGAHYNSAVSVASDIVIGYYQLIGKKPEDIGEVLDKIEQLSPRVKEMVDKLAGADKKEEAPAAQPAPAPSPEQQSLNNQAPAQQQGVITNVDEQELKW